MPFNIMNSLKTKSKKASSGLWVAVGGGSRVATSTTGTTWAGANIGGFNVDVNTVAYGNGLFVAGGGGRLIKSINGTSWTETSLVVGTFYGPWVIAYGKDGSGAELWVAAGNKIIISPNGTTNWTSAAVSIADLNYMAYLNGLWVGVGLGGMLAKSTDGTNWTSTTGTLGSLGNTNCIEYGKDGSGAGLWIAVGGGRNLHCEKYKWNYLGRRILT